MTLHELGYSVSEIAQKLNQKEEKVIEILDSTNLNNAVFYDGDKK